jgi:EAL domain-containing protein (putative c-di-GMP-specific phosphodiesterase class I)/PAS domain-containing protein
MDDPMRVLVVEHRHTDHGIAEQLLADYELDFSWQRVESPVELRQTAADFDPNIVLCTDDVSMTSSRAVLDALRLLCSRTPVILVSSVRGADESAAGDATTLIRGAARQPFEGTPRHSIPDLPPPQGAEDIAHLRRCFSSLLESSCDPAVMSNADGWITHANISACRRLDGSCERSLGTLLGTPSDQGAHDSHRTDGSHRLAYFDAWTRQPTLIHTHDLIGCVTARADGCRSALALVALDLDSVRIPDDRLPAADGADVQCEVARHASMVRIAQDGFLWVLPHLSSAADAAIVVQRVLESIARTCPEAGPRRQDRRASRPVVETQPAIHESSRLEASLGDALQRHALSIQYQPQFELHTGRGCGVEALARWTLCTGQIIAPSVFIPLAERIGMIHALGAWVLKSACETAYAWCSRDAQRTTLSVNVSALQINEQFCTVIQRALKDSGFPAKHLELEITESALIGHADRTIECLKQWKRLGVQIAVDDFGTGYSSLNYLSRLPVDRLKLDQSLIHRMTLDAKSATVMRSIISLGADLGIDVIAEGVETEQQLRMLEDLGCPRVQGYLLGRPMPPKQAQVALRKAWGNRPSPAYRPSKIASGEARVQ